MQEILLQFLLSGDGTFRAVIVLEIRSVTFELHLGNGSGVGNPRVETGGARVE